MSRRTPSPCCFLFPLPPSLYASLLSCFAPKIIAIQLSIKTTYSYQFNWFFRSISAIQKWQPKKNNKTPFSLSPSININDMDLTMCYTNEAKAHSWHEISTEKWKRKRRKLYLKCGGKWETGRQRQNNSNSKRNANKKWEMPRLFPNKVKGSFQHNCSMFARRKIFRFLCFFVSLTGLKARAKLAMILRVVETKKTKPIFHSATEISPHYVKEARSIFWGDEKGEEYFKKWWKLFLLRLLRLILILFSFRFFFFLDIFVKDYFVSFFPPAGVGNHRANSKKTPNDDSIHISNHRVFAAPHKHRNLYTAL